MYKRTHTHTHTYTKQKDCPVDLCSCGPSCYSWTFLWTSGLFLLSFLLQYVQGWRTGGPAWSIIRQDPGWNERDHIWSLSQVQKCKRSTKNGSTRRNLAARWARWHHLTPFPHQTVLENVSWIFCCCCCHIPSPHRRLCSPAIGKRDEFDAGWQPNGSDQF